MNATRAWVVLLTVVVFLSGAAAGVLAERMSAKRSDRGPMEDYALALAAEFDLSPERQGHLRVLLNAYDRDVSRVMTKHEIAYHSDLEPDLRPLYEEYDRLIRDMVLPAHQRARFDELAAGITLNPNSGGN